VLDKAEIEKADLLLAVTDRDEVNILACIYANAVGVPRKVARVADPEFTRASSRLDLHKLGVDLVMCHKEETAQDMFSTLRHPGSLEVVDLLGERLLAVGIEVEEHSPLITAPLKKLSEHPMFQSMRLLALVRAGQVIVPHGDTRVLPGDNAYVAIQPKDADAFLAWSCPDRVRYDKVVIAGGGDLGLRLAQLLEALPLQVVLLEPNVQRAEECSGALDRATVIQADALIEESLENAGVNQNSAFVSVTGDDEGNIIGCLLAQKRGAVFTMAKVAKTEYVPVIESLTLLDRVVSPQQPMVNAILHFVRGQNVKAATLLYKLPGELLEIALTKKSEWAGKEIKDIRLPRGAVIAGVQRGDAVLVPTGALRLVTGDLLVVFSLPRTVGKLKSVIAG
ncbi:MAG: Trk system potassium transporter TrkA, partial [Kiritimatiellae bacterium]|nr:Trk system potassium transporter TrkA [Kiritimatiellia bacterium]